MVILHLYDAINGHRYRHFSYDYFVRVSHASTIVESWIVPGTV